MAHLRWPSEHCTRIRTTHLLERALDEGRRSTKGIGRFLGETSALSLIWRALELLSRRWHGRCTTGAYRWVEATRMSFDALSAE